jgi:integrase
MIPVKAIFATALEDQLIRSNPARAVKLSARSANADDEDANAKALTEEQLALFIESTPADHRLMIELMSDTGLRIGETLGLKWKDIDFGKERLTVRRQVSRKRFAPPKSKNGKRTIRLTHSMAQALWPLRGADDAPVFGDAGQHLDYHRAKEAILPAVRKATGLGWVSFHTLRHTLATRLFRNGANVKQVQVWLGHNSPGFTLETYVHLLPEDLPDVAFLEVARAERPALAAKAAQESAEPLRTAALG